MGLVKSAVKYAVLGFFVHFIVTRCLLLGFFSHIQYHQPGPCRTLPGIEHGSEDAQATPEGLLFITTGMKHMTHPSHPNFKDHYGQIFLLDTNIKNVDPVALPIQGGLNRETFSPHGISLWKKSGNQYVYVVNHAGDKDFVEKFLFEPSEKVLKHLKSIRCDKYGMINDLVMVGVDKFYVTYYQYTRSSLGHKLEGYLSLHWGSVGYYDGQTEHQVLTGLGQPNGINMSPDRKYLYVALIYTKAVAVYKISKDGALSELQRINVNTMPDNIDVDKNTGDIFIGCHPIAYKVIPYMDDPRTHQPPSQVLRLIMQDGGATDIEEIYAEDGHLIFGSTVGVYVNKKLYIGTVYHKMAECEVKYMS